MTIRTPLALALIASLALPIGMVQPVFAAEDVSNLGCPQLWHRKNALLKSKGLCFRDPRAIRIFGNDGCTTEDEVRLPLTPAEREQMARIVLSEKIKLCR
jgi:hypothetical protein